MMMIDVDDDDDDDDEDVEGNSFSTRAALSYIYRAKRQKDPRTGPIESGVSTITRKVPTASKRGQKTI
jgi:hypothetical protein